MSIMKQWMSGSGDGDNEPFVMIDWVSGRLRPLYMLNIHYDAKSGENVDYDAAVFNPTMLDLVLSPGQKEACEKVMTTTQEVNTLEYLWFVCFHRKTFYEME